MLLNWYSDVLPASLALTTADVGSATMAPTEYNSQVVCGLLVHLTLHGANHKHLHSSIHLHLRVI